MEDESQPELFKCQLRLKEQLAAIPLTLREKFIGMLCEKLGLDKQPEREKLFEKLMLIFAALDAERN